MCSAAAAPAAAFVFVVVAVPRSRSSRLVSRDLSPENGTGKNGPFFATFDSYEETKSLHLIRSTSPKDAAAASPVAGDVRLD